MSYLESQRLAKLSTAVRESSLKRLRAVPEGRENWRPTTDAMSFADLAQHLVDADNWLLKMLELKNLKPIIGRAGLIEIKNREEYLNLLEELAQSGVRRDQTIRAMTDKELAEMIYDARFGREVSAWWIVVRGNLDHETHHRGQIATYLKLPGGAGTTGGGTDERQA
ncbi:MAG: DinB family protein [bacterium]